MHGEEAPPDTAPGTAPDPPQIRCLPDGHPPRVILIGEIDLAVQPALDAALAALLARPTRDVVVDLSRTAFFGCTAISFLARLANRLRARGGRLYLASPSPIARRVLAYTGLDGVITVLSGPDAPVAASAPGAAGGRAPADHSGYQGQREDVG